MKPRDIKTLVYLGAILIGLGTYGAIQYVLNRDSFHKAFEKFAKNHPDDIQAIRGDLLAQEGISNDGSAD